MLEQVLSITVGLADTIMVSSVGEAAVSGVSLVDMLNVLIINIFSALATGGAVVVAQLLGARERKRACDASRQLYLVVIVISLIIAVLIMLFRVPLLRLLFGSIEDDVMDSALTYLTVSVFSYPILAIYNAGAALFRAQGNSRISMLIAGLINVVNLIGNSILIYVLKWGVAGAALSSVFSRGVAAVVITVLLLHPDHPVTLLTEHMDEMTRVAEYLIRNETMDGDTFVKVYNGEIVPDKVVGEDLMEELKEELDAKVGKAPESAEAARAAAAEEKAQSAADDTTGENK